MCLESQESLQSPRKWSRYVDSYCKMSGNDWWNKYVLWQQSVREVDDWISGGKLFQRMDAATGNERRSTVARRYAGTCSRCDEDERRRCQSLCPRSYVAFVLNCVAYYVFVLWRAKNLACSAVQMIALIGNRWRDVCRHKDWERPPGWLRHRSFQAPGRRCEGNWYPLHVVSHTCLAVFVPFHLSVQWHYSGIGQIIKSLLTPLSLQWKLKNKSDHDPYLLADDRCPVIGFTNSEFGHFEPQLIHAESL